MIRRPLLLAFLLPLFAAALPEPVHGASAPPADQSASAPPLGDQPRLAFVPSADASVPMRLFGGKPVVEVRIDGRGPFALFLDTGASVTVLDASFAAELGLPQIGTTRVGDPQDPEGVEAAQHRIERLEIGSARFESFFAVAFDRSDLYRGATAAGEPAPRGVLGMPLFREVVLTIDYPGKAIRFSNAPLPIADGREIVDFQPSESGLFGVPMRIAGTEQLMTLDSGSQSSLSFPDSFRSRLPLVAPPREIGKGRTVGGEAIVYGAQLDGDAELGAIRLAKPELRFFGRLTHGNLGSRFLSNYTVSIDQRNRRLRFVAGRAEAATAAGSASAPGSLAQWAGRYGERRLSFADGRLFLQRLSGPQGAGPQIALTEVSPGRFTLEGQTEPRVELVSGESGAEPVLKVKTAQGAWESNPRSGPH